MGIKAFLRLFVSNFVWPCLLLTEKQRSFNHMIIFNDSVSTFYQCSVWNSPRQSANIYVSWYLLRQKKKKNAEAMKFLGTLKKYVSKNKLYFCLKKKSNVSNILNIFKPNLIMQIIYCIIHRCLYSLFILFLFSYISF